MMRKLFETELFHVLMTITCTVIVGVSVSPRDIEVKYPILNDEN